MASNNPNGLRTVLPNAGGGFAVQGSEIAAATIEESNIVANTLTSASMALTGLQYASVTLTPAQIKTLYSAPTEIIAAPGAGKSIVIHQALARFTYTAPQYTSGGAVQLQYDSTIQAGGTTPLTTLAAAVVQAAATSDTVLQTAATSTTADINKGIYASCATADFATGTVATLNFRVWYSIV